MGMSFVDELAHRYSEKFQANPDAMNRISIVVVDQNTAPGGHWLS